MHNYTNTLDIIDESHKLINELSTHVTDGVYHTVHHIFQR